VHKLSAPVLREHLRRADESGDGFAGSVQRAREIDRARRERQERGERNAWQWGRDMDAVREGDERRGVYRGVRRDFEDEEREGEREREGVVPIVGNEVDKERHRRSFMGFEGRGDWAQQEDRVGLRENKGKKGLREIIRLFGMGKRKAEKEMVIRTSTAKQDSMRLEKLTSAETETESEGGRRSRRSSLFTRLKWHSSHAAAHES
jgi:hypothetical protein